MSTKIQQLLFISILILLAPIPAKATLSNKQLSDSLTQYAGFDTRIVPKVRVTNLRTKDQRITLYTNKTLGCLALTEEELTNLQQQISLWVLGHKNAKVTIYSDKYELGELITDRVHSRCEHYTLPTRNALPYGERLWSAPNGLDNRNIALWPSHGMYYNQDMNMWHWQRARMWTMVEDLYSYEFTHTWLIPMLENAGAYVIEPRARDGEYYQKDSVWLWLGDRIAPKGAKTRYFFDEMGSIQRGPDKLTSGHPRWMEGARYWLEYTGYPDSIWNVNQGTNDYKDDLQCRGLWVNYLCGGSPSNPKQKGLGLQIDACLALHTDGYTAPQDSQYIGTLAIYTDHDDQNNHKFPTGVSRMVNRDLADYLQTQIVEDIRRQAVPNWPRRELNNASYCESRYPVVPTVLLEILSHKNLADIQKGLDPKFQFIFCRAIYKGLGRWLMGDNFVVQPLPVHAAQCRLENGQCVLEWQPTIDSFEPSATPDYYIVSIAEYEDMGSPIHTIDTIVYKTTYQFTPNKDSFYNLYIQAGNKGGISLVSEGLSFKAPEQKSIRCLLINNDHRIDGPEWFVDSLRAGIVPGSYAIPYRYSQTYLGDQWIYDKQRDVRDNGWKDDDNCGWGMCHMDYVGKPLQGNFFEYCAQRGAELYKNCMEIAQDSAFVSYSADAITPADSTLYDYLEIHCGQQNYSLFPKNIRHLIELHIASGKHIVLRGTYLGSALNSEEREWAERVLGYKLAAPRATVPQGKRNAPDAVKSTGNGKVISRYADTGLPRTLEIQNGKAIITIICE